MCNDDKARLEQRTGRVCSYAPFLKLTTLLMAASALALASLGPTPSAAGTAAQVH
jgi:hypothetical protein